MRRFLYALIALAFAGLPAAAFAPAQLATVAGAPANQPLAWSGFAPPTLGAALAADWNADDHGTARMTDDGAGLISAWADSVSSISVTAATTARGTWSASSFTGSDGIARAGITFDGTANNYTNTSFAALPQGATAGEIHSAASPTSSGANAILIRYGGTAGGTLRGLQKTATDHCGDTDGTTSVTDVPKTYTGPHLCSGSWSGTTMDGRVDGQFYRSAGLARVTGTIASLNTGTTRLRIGASNATAAASFFPGVVRRILITALLTVSLPNAPLIQPQEQQLEGYLAWDCGLTSLLPYDHPYRWRKP